MKYRINLKNTNLKTDSTKIAKNVIKILNADDSAKRKHGFNVTCEDRHRIFYLKDKLHRTLKAKTNVELHNYFNDTDDSFFNIVNHWKKEEILFIVENINSRLKTLVNSPQLYRHSMNSIRMRRCAIRAKRTDILPQKIVNWLIEIGYINSRI
jgi:hypothetical protein